MVRSSNSKFELLNESPACLSVEIRNPEIIRQQGSSSNYANDRPSERPNEREIERASDRAIERVIDRASDHEQVITRAPDGLLTR